MEIKKYYENIYKDEFEITNKRGDTVKVEKKTIHVSGDAVLFGDFVSSRHVTSLTYETGGYIQNRKVKRAWPLIKRVVNALEEESAILLEDYIEVEEPIEGYDENPFVTSIYYYISFDGKMLSDAYIPILDFMYPMSSLEGYEIYPDFNERYNKIKRKIAKKIQKIMQTRNANIQTKEIKELKIRKEEII